MCGESVQCNCAFILTALSRCVHMQQNDIHNQEIQIYMKPLNVESRCNWMNMAAEALKCGNSAIQWMSKWERWKKILEDWQKKKERSEPSMSECTNNKLYCIAMCEMGFYHAIYRILCNRCCVPCRLSHRRIQLEKVHTFGFCRGGIITHTHTKNKKRNCYGVVSAVMNNEVFEGV